MEITRTTVPGAGTVHHVTTRDGERLGVLVERARRTLLTYDPTHPTDPDTPATAISLTPQEADAVANLLHSRPVPDRLADLERRVAALAGR